MPPMNTKNIPLSATGTELGLGTGLTTQVQDVLADDEARKKLLGSTTQGVARDLGLAPMGLMNYGGNFFTK